MSEEFVKDRLELGGDTCKDCHLQKNICYVCSRAEIEYSNNFVHINCK